MAAVFAALWLLWPPAKSEPPTAQAQIPDPAAQRLAVQRELQGIRAELVEIRKLLASGKLQVHVTQERERGSAAGLGHGP